MIIVVRGNTEIQKKSQQKEALHLSQKRSLFSFQTTISVKWQTEPSLGKSKIVHEEKEIAGRFEII